ncbi:MAG: nickel pincer cofactor biosynthesis protein LarB [Chloroflexota bacterium]|nr:nickel pincer cofactor biosynthesis protein LarB [Chloroflexota bacterium]
MRDLLERLLRNEISIDQVERLLQINEMAEIQDAALDLSREFRAGVPEVVLGEGKTSAHVVDIVLTFLASKGRAIVTRASEEQISAVSEAIPEGCDLWVNDKARLIVAQKQGVEIHKIGRKVGIMTGGTSDILVAEEARVVAEEMGCDVITAYDVGIAGFHRHIKPLKRMIEEGVDAIVVIAGMEGALPSVVSSLVDVPVIGVPTSVGYGFGAQGIGALTTMLQTCSPGLCVVNIDNGVGAGAYAALIARGVARALREASGAEGQK